MIQSIRKTGKQLPGPFITILFGNLYLITNFNIINNPKIISKIVL